MDGTTENGTWDLGYRMVFFYVHPYEIEYENKKKRTPVSYILLWFIANTTYFTALLLCTTTTITVKYSGHAGRGAVVSRRLFSLGTGERVPPKTKLERRIFRKLFLVRYFQKTPFGSALVTLTLSIVEESSAEPLRETNQNRFYVRTQVKPLWLRNFEGGGQGTTAKKKLRAQAASIISSSPGR